MGVLAVGMSLIDTNIGSYDRKDMAQGMTQPQRGDAVREEAFVKPRVQGDAARERLARCVGPWFVRLLFAKGKAEPRKVELIYFPYYLFKISVVTDSSTRDVSVACDGVLGTVAFMEMEQLDFLADVDAPRFEFRLAAEEARQNALDECRWMLIKNGLHRKNAPRLDAVTEVRRLYYPYWIAYYKKRWGSDFNAVDGISRAPLGMRMRRAFLAALAEKG